MHRTDAKVCCEILFIFPLNVNNSSSPHIISGAHIITEATILQKYSNILPRDPARNIFKLNRTKHVLLSFLGADWQRIMSAPQSSIL